MSSIAHRPRHSLYPLISMDEATDLVIKECKDHLKETELSLEDSLFHVLAEDIISSENHPPFPASIKDGYALIASDGKIPRKVIGASTAGKSLEVQITPGFCVRISTGAAVPRGADCVIQVEDTKLLEEQNGDELSIEILVAPTVGQDIRPIGSDIEIGQKLLTKGKTIGPSEIGILASIGKSRVKVYKKPKVAVLSTGNELHCFSTKDLPYGAIRDSNRPQTIALLRKNRFEYKDYGVANDEMSSIVTKFHHALSECDVVITSGGVSMGERDLLKTAIVDNLAFDIHFGRVMMKPGKPTTFASGYLKCDVEKRNKKFIFALPGNPVSAFVTYYLFVQPALRLISGQEYLFETELQVMVATDNYKLDSRPEFVRAILNRNISNDKLMASMTEENQMSSRLSSTLQANLLLALPGKSEEKDTLYFGDLVKAIQI